MSRHSKYSPPFGSSSSPCLRQPSGSEKPFKEKSYTFSPGQLNPNLVSSRHFHVPVTD